MIALDATIVNVALPHIAADLSGSTSSLQWVVDAYLIMLATFQLSAGTIADRLGSARVYRGGLVAFTVASLACAVAPGMTALIADRVAQGVAAAVMLPSSLAVIRSAYEDEVRRTRAIVIWVGAGGIAVAAGPICGGLLTAFASWRAIFILNLPVALVAVLTLGRPVHGEPVRISRRLDVPGQLLSLGALGLATAGLIEGGRLGFGRMLVVTALLTAAAAAVAFVAVERSRLDPMLPLAIFRRAALVAVNLSGFILNFAFYGTIFLLSLFFQQILHHSVLVAGLMFLPLTGLVSLVNVLSGRLATRVGAKVPLLLGNAIFAASLVTLLTIDRSTRTWLILLLLVPLGVGGGMAVPPLAVVLFEATPRQLSGIASGVLNTSRQFGGAIGVALFGALTHEHFVTGMHTAVAIGAGAVLASLALSMVLIRPGRTNTSPSDPTPESGPR